ncbi:MAG: DVU_1553 family AMP-dependent CoA ligase [Desulfovibrionaceae bacterium]
MPALTPLDPWIAVRLGCASPVTRTSLDAWQAARLRETVARAQAASPFYAAHLAGMDAASLASPAHVANLPLMTEDTLRREGQRLLCVPQDAVARVVSLRSSGTTGPAKRLCFSDADLELTMDFFAHGMTTFTRPGQTVCILLPGQSPDSVGDLLARALARFGARGVIHGLAPDPAEAVRVAAACRAGVIVGFPVQVLAMARLAEASRTRLAPTAVLLCSDYVPRAVEREVDRIWGCPVHSHWGTVETGLGGGVSCAARDGCHLREADLLVEVLAPDNTPLPDGAWGELAITTLTRRAMPLIRYRTGDLGRVLPGPCACGSAVRRLDRVQGRLAQAVPMPGAATLTMPLLDEALLPVPGVLDVRASLSGHNGNRCLHAALATLPGCEDAARRAARDALAALPSCAGLSLDITTLPWTEPGISPAKRTLRREP